MKKELSIIIVSFNTRALTEKCVKSIISSHPKVSYEIIVVDNGSKDGTAEALKRFDIKVIGNKENLGFAKASNQGIKVAKGKYILLLNSDTLVKKGTLGELVNFATKTKDAGVVGARLLNIDGTIQPSAFHFPTIAGAIKEYWIGKKGSYELYAPVGEKPQKVDSVVGAAFLISPEARRKIEFLNENYFMYFEDLDYCRRVWENGLKVYYLPEAEVIHYHGASGKDVVKPAFQWRRLIPSSKIYHGILKHTLINFIIWSGQKWQKLFGQK